MSAPTRIPASNVLYKCDGNNDNTGCCSDQYEYCFPELLRWVVSRWMCYSCFNWANMNQKHVDFVIDKSWGSYVNLREHLDEAA